MNRNFHTIFYLMIAGFFFVSISALGQAEFNASGLGRGVLTNNKLEGNILENDTASVRKGLSGYNMFDLGFPLPSRAARRPGSGPRPFYTGT
jgi:hypothetical protein